MTNIQLFTFNQKEVRTIVKPNSSIWFVASDVAKQLDYSNTNDLTRMLDNDESATHNMRIRSENGSEQSREVSIINESGLYHAIFKSRKTEAKTFRKWVTSEVLPSIRKTGSYSIEQTQQLEQNIKTLEQNNKTLCDVIAKYENTLPQEMAKQLCNLVKEKVNENNQHSKNKAYSYIWNKLKNYFEVTEYKQIPQNRFGEAVEFINTLQVPKFLNAEQIDLLEPVSRKLAHGLNDEDAKRAIYVQKVSPQLVELMHSVISNTETLLMKNSLGRVQFLDQTLQEIKEKSQVIHTLLKSV